MSSDTAAVAKAGVCADDADQRLPAAITHAPVFLQRQQRPPRPPVHARSSSSWTPDGLLAKDRSRGIKNRMEFFRGALGSYLKQLGAEDAAALFVDATAA